MSGRGVRVALAADALWLLVWAAASSTWCITAAHQLGATFDEPFYLSAGLEGWRTGSHRALLTKGTMPLPADLQTLPLYLAERWTGHAVDLDLPADFDWSLRWARAMTLIFWWLILTHGMLAARAIAGPWGGRVATALLACEPSLLAHASLATTDVALTACVLMLAYYFRVGRAGHWGRRVGVPTLCFAATLLAKASGATLAAVCLLVIELERLWRLGALRASTPVGRGKWWRHLLVELGPFWSDAAWIGAGGVLLTVIYCGSDWNVEPSFVAWAHTLADQPFGPAAIWVAEHVRIFSNAGEAFVRQVGHNVRGHGAYLLGHSDPRALWYYFPVILSIKLSEPVVAAPLLLAAVRPRALANWACLTAAAMVLLSVTFRVQLGVRMVLPAVVLLIVGLAAAAVNAVRESAPPWRYVLQLGTAAALLWTASVAVRVWPHGLSYVNQFWGGPQTGFTLVSDANYDWGQGLVELARWAEERGLAVLPVWYFGTDPAIRNPPFRDVPLHGLPIRTGDDVVAQAGGGYLAVSTTLLYGNAILDAHRRAATFLRTQQPIARTTTFLIYDFAAPRLTCDADADSCRLR